MIDKIVLRIAKSAILSKFDAEYQYDKEQLLEEYPFLRKDGATFVTLEYAHKLRGCIGSIIPHTSLYEDIVHNAQSAAFGDPRFPPLTSQELDMLELEVSILSTPEILQYENYEDLRHKIRPNVDGLILKYGAYQGTFLPQVWEQLPTPMQFLEHLSMKAGADPSIYIEHPTIYRYSVEHISEPFHAILPL